MFPSGGPRQPEFDFEQIKNRILSYLGPIGKRLGEPESETLAWLETEFRLDPGAARTILSHLREQQQLCDFVPSDRQLLVEGYVDNRGRRAAVFHFPFGRRVNDALARAFAYELGRDLGASVRISLNDDSFLLTFPDFVELEGIGETLDPEALEATLRRAISNTELFAQRFRHCANRSFMVLRNYKGHAISLPRQQLRTSQVLEAIHELPSFPMLEEAYREVLHDAFDLEHAHEVLADIASGERSVSYRPYSTVPSPLASPVFADPEGWPPILIHTSENDLHFDDAIRMAENGQKHGCDVRINYWDSPRHHLERLSSETAAQSFGEVNAFINRHWRPDGP